MRYPYAVLIDYDGKETRHEFRKRIDALHAFTEYLENAATNKLVFSVTLIDQIADKQISNWERE